MVDPDEQAAECAAAMYAADHASRALDIQISDVAPGRATATMVVTEAMINGHRMCHGGYVFLLADTAFAFACNTHDEVTVAAGGDITFLRPAGLGDALTATATEHVRRGRTGLCDVTVRDGRGEIVAELRGRSHSLGRRLLDD